MTPKEPKPGVTDHLMLGYALHIGRLKPEDLEWTGSRPDPIDLGDSQLKDCVAVEGEDLGQAIHAIVDVANNRTVWSSTLTNDGPDAQWVPLPLSEQEPFAMAVVLILRWCFPHLRGELPMRPLGEHYGRTDAGERIGPYDSVADLERELAAANSRALILEQARRLDPFWLDEEATSGAEPGPYEGIEDKELAVAIDTIANHGSADEEVGSVIHGLHGARIDRFVLWTDDRGFKSIMTYDSVGEAKLELEAEDARQNPAEDAETT